MDGQRRGGRRDATAVCQSRRHKICKVQSKPYDSGASGHMSQCCKQFVTDREISDRPITAANNTNNKNFHTIGMGDLLQILVPDSTTSTKVLLRDTLHTPDLGLRVVSIG